MGGEGHIEQEDKPRSRIVAEYLAHGYAMSDTAIQRALELDSKHGVSSRFTNALSSFDQKYKATDTAKSMDSKYGVSDKAYSAWGWSQFIFRESAGHTNWPEDQTILRLRRQASQRRPRRGPETGRSEGRQTARTRVRNRQHRRCSGHSARIRQRYRQDSLQMWWD